MFRQGREGSPNLHSQRAWKNPKIRIKRGHRCGSYVRGGGGDSKGGEGCDHRRTPVPLSGAPPCSPQEQLSAASALGFRRENWSILISASAHLQMRENRVAKGGIWRQDPSNRGQAAGHDREEPAVLSR